MGKKPSSRPVADARTLSYEQAVDQLEQIIDHIESGETGLEASLAEYERGMELLKRCREILSVAEQRVEDLTSKLSGDDDPSKD